jgi:hypothetical protein
MKEKFLYIARCIAWGFIETISFIARHPGLVVAFLIAIVILKILQAISLSIINN